MKKKEIITKAKEMLRSLGEVDIIKLASEEGVSVVAVDTDDNYNAHIEYDEAKDNFAIFVNAAHSYNRVKFSIAHELAHFVLHPDLIKKFKRLNRGYSEHFDKDAEKEANAFASEILMPADVIEEKVHSLGDRSGLIRQSTLRSLVDFFKVSKEAMQYRLTDLDYEIQLA